MKNETCYGRFKKFKNFISSQVDMSANSFEVKNYESMIEFVVLFTSTIIQNYKQKRKYNI